MNMVSLMGRITAEVECKYTKGDNANAWTRFAIAVDGRKKDEVSFINIVAFGKTAEILNDKSKKGGRVAVTGYIKTGSYTNKDGNKVNTFDIVADRVEIIDFKENQATVDDEELPFN